MDDAIAVSEEKSTLPKVSSPDAGLEVKQETNQRRLPKITGELVTDLLKIASITASISAIFHLYAFGITAKINILAYVSLTDFLRVAIVWIAPTCVLLIVSFFFGSAFSTILTTYEVQHSTQANTGCFIREFEKKAKNLIICSLVVLNISIFILDIYVWLGIDARQIYDLLYVNCTLAWLCLVSWYISSIKRLTNFHFVAYAEYIILGPLLVIASVGSGLAHGASTTQIKSSDVVSITVDNNIHRGELLFSFEKFVVIREFEREYITLIPSDKITSLRAAFNLSSEKESASKK